MILDTEARRELSLTLVCATGSWLVSGSCECEVTPGILQCLHGARHIPRLRGRGEWSSIRSGSLRP